jgi:hypothetical protein
MSFQISYIFCLFQKLCFEFKCLFNVHIFLFLVPPQLMMTFNRNSSSTEWKTVMQELTLHKEEVERLREELEEVKLNFKHEIETLKDQVTNLAIMDCFN